MHIYCSFLLCYCLMNKVKFLYKERLAFAMISQRTDDIIETWIALHRVSKSHRFKLKNALTMRATLHAVSPLPSSQPSSGGRRLMMYMVAPANNRPSYISDDVLPPVTRHPSCPGLLSASATEDTLPKELCIIQSSLPYHTHTHTHTHTHQTVFSVAEWMIWNCFSNEPDI